MISLILCVGLLILAPVIHYYASSFPLLWKRIIQICQWVVIALILGHIMPECVHAAGYSVGLTFLVGLFVPSLMERLFAQKAESIHHTSILITLCGLLIHSMGDGAALSIPQMQELACHDHSHHHDHISSHGSYWLQLAVILHNLPVGLVIWSFTHKNKFFAINWLLLNGLFTIFGFYLGASMFEQIHDSVPLAYFQSFFSGSLLHILIDRHDGSHHHHSCAHHDHE